MKQIGSYEAKTHLADLLAEVQGGEIVIITRRGVPIAKLVPVETPQVKVEAAKERLKALREQTTPGNLSIREMIEEGRRF